MRYNQLIAIATTLGLVSGSFLIASTAPVSADTLCSASGDHPDGLTVTDMTFGIPGTASQNNADDCYGLFTVDGAGSPSDELIAVNDIWGDPDFTFLSKFEVDDNMTESGNPLEGVNFTLSSEIGEEDETGSFQVTWDPAMDLTIDFVFLMKGANGEHSNAMYLFEGLSLGSFSSGMGSLTVKVETPNGNVAGLSHLSLFGRTGETGDIPVPASLWLLGSGLIGLGAFARQRRP